MTLRILLILGLIGVCRAELPMEVRFKGGAVFERLVRESKKQGWRELDLGDRTVAIGKALLGTPYKGFTLEIDDHVEAPSVNLEGMDCWTFFEISLAMARLIEETERPTREGLLRKIEEDRYRGGKCDGNYLSRLHYLADWIMDNQKRGLVKDISRSIGGVRFEKKCFEMTTAKGVRAYRYLRENPELVPLMRKHEERISKLPVYHVPKRSVAKIESKLRNGDVVCITTHPQGAFCSHVGLAYRDEKGTLRFMHASSNYRKVVIDSRLSDYLAEFRYHAGIFVARPLRPVDSP